MPCGQQACDSETHPSAGLVLPTWRNTDGRTGGHPAMQNLGALGPGTGQIQNRALAHTGPFAGCRGNATIITFEALIRRMEEFPRQDPFPERNHELGKSMIKTSQHVRRHAQMRWQAAYCYAVCTSLSTGVVCTHLAPARSIQKWLGLVHCSLNLRVVDQHPCKALIIS